MPTFDEATAQAEAILAQKTKGPNGVIAYAVVNDERLREDGTKEPYFNPESTNRTELAYAFFETDRVGVPVISAPGGTQDVLATNPETGETITIELLKDKTSKAALAALDEEVPDIKDVAELEKYTIAKLLERGWDVRMEDSFAAAAREGFEEQGVDLRNKANYIGTPMQFERKAMTKRTIQDIEKALGGKSFDLKGITDLEGVRKVVEGIKQNAPEGVTLQTPQMLFAAQMPDFSSVKLADSGEKTENKIQGRIGSKFREKGTFVTLKQMEEKLIAALPLAQEQEEKGNAFARQDIVATFERLQLLKTIEAAIVKDLQAKGVNVNSSVSPGMATKPDRMVEEHEGTAQMPEDIMVRAVKRNPGQIAAGQ